MTVYGFKSQKVTSLLRSGPKSLRNTLGNSITQHLWLNLISISHWVTTMLTSSGQVSMIACQPTSIRQSQRLFK